MPRISESYKPHHAGQRTTVLHHTPGLSVCARRVEADRGVLSRDGTVCLHKRGYCGFSEHAGIHQCLVSNYATQQENAQDDTKYIERLQPRTGVGVRTPGCACGSASSRGMCLRYGSNGSCMTATSGSPWSSEATFAPAISSGCLSIWFANRHIVHMFNSYVDDCRLAHLQHSPANHKQHQNGT